MKKTIISMFIIILLTVSSAFPAYAFDTITDNSSVQTVYTQAEYRVLFENAGVSTPHGALFGPAFLGNHESGNQIASMVVENGNEVAHTYLFDFFIDESGEQHLMDLDTSMDNSIFTTNYYKAGTRGNVTATAYYNRLASGSYYYYQPTRLEAVSSIVQNIEVSYSINGHTYNSSLAPAGNDDPFDIYLSQYPAAKQQLYYTYRTAPYYYKIVPAIGYHYIAVKANGVTYDAIALPG